MSAVNPHPGWHHQSSHHEDEPVPVNEEARTINASVISGFFTLTTGDVVNPGCDVVVDAFGTWGSAAIRETSSLTFRHPQFWPVPIPSGCPFVDMREIAKLKLLIRSPDKGETDW